MCVFLKLKRGTGKQGSQDNDVCAKCPLVWWALGKWKRRGYGRWQAGNHQPGSERATLRKSYESRSLYVPSFLPFPSSFKFDYWMGKSPQGHKQTAILEWFFKRGDHWAQYIVRKLRYILCLRNPPFYFFIASSTCLSKQNHFTRNIQEVSSLETMSGWFILKFPLHPSPSRN